MMFLLFACAPDNTVGIRLSPPSAAFIAPSEGQSFFLGELVALAAEVSDPDTADAGELSVNWSVDQAGGAVTPGDVTAEGLASASWMPTSVGEVQITLHVVDSDAQEDSATVHVTIVANPAPVVMLTSPSDGDVLYVDSPFTLTGRVGDDNDGAAALTLAWTSAGGELADCATSTDVLGEVMCVPSSLPLGDQELCLTATDPWGSSGEACANITVEDCVTTWHSDADGDTFGDDTLTMEACDPPPGYVAIGGDCDDADAAFYPAAVEADCADPNDYNCDGSTGYADADGDGFAACVECDDAEGAINPAAAELCDGLDNNCDGAIDEPSAVDALTWYQDNDADLYGDASVTATSCSQPAGYVAAATDCDDADSAVNPAAAELCDGLDNNCDRTIDEPSAVDALTWYQDNDADRYGDASVTSTSCSQPVGYVADAADCDDADSAVNPAAAELCDRLDNDCDGTIDDASAVDALSWYQDNDADLYGDASVAVTSCSQPAGYVSDATDCDDTDALVYPGASDPLDGIDQDCDGLDASCGASTRNVPADYATIQEAINESCDGDVVEVSAGTYTENIDFSGKDLTVQGAGSGVTILDGDANGSSVVTMDGGTLSGFTVTNGLATNGGGIYVGTGTGATLSDLAVDGNTAGVAGGGLYATNADELTVSSCTFDDNVAEEYGGGVYLSGGSIHATDSDANRNTLLALTAYGGGWYASSTGSSADPSTFDSVNADENTVTAGVGYGGGAYLSGTFTWTGGGASDNAAGLYYGGVYASGTFALSSLTIAGNTASMDAALHAAGGGVSTIEDVTLSNNTQGGPRLAMLNSVATRGLVVWDNSFASGGLFLYGGSLSGLDMRGNTGGFQIYIYRSISIDHSVIAGNTGGGVFIDATGGQTVTLTNTTITGNSGWGVSAYADLIRGITLTNVVVSENGGYGISNGYIYAPVVEFCDAVDNSGGNYTGMTDPTGTDGNVSVDPGFVSWSAAMDPSTWDLHLAPGSALIDAGDSALLDPDGSNSDIGAYGGPAADFDYYDDADLDGLYDGWELAAGLDITSDDSAADSDADGLDNAAEFSAGTDPGTAHTDGDGRSDGVEVTAGTDPLDVGS